MYYALYYLHLKQIFSKHTCRNNNDVLCRIRIHIPCHNVYSVGQPVFRHCY